MTPEELQQIQAIIQSAVAPITTRLDGLEKGQKNLEQGQQQINTRLNTLGQGQQQLTKQVAAVETKITTLETKVEKSEQKILKKLDQLELLAADYLDGQVQTTKRRLDRVEKILNITP
jgi:chromosome segregation ATPase